MVEIPDHQLERFLNDVNAETTAIRVMLQALIVTMLDVTSQPDHLISGLKERTLKRLADEAAIAAEGQPRRRWEMAHSRAGHYFDELYACAGLRTSHESAAKN